MFCARCGQQIPDVSEVCPLCGREATAKIESPAATSVTAAAAAPGQIKWPDEPQTISPPARRPGLKGVGGWLLFFCILLTLVNPAAVFVMAWSGGFSEDNLVYFAWAVFGVVVGAMLWNVNQRVFVLLWIYFAITVLIQALAIVGMAASEDKVEASEMTLTLRGLVYTVIWFLYFKKSDRVQATFGRNL